MPTGTNRWPRSTANCRAMPAKATSACSAPRSGWHSTRAAPACSAAWPARPGGRARLFMDPSQGARAEDHLHRAIAQGAGAEAWELLGHVFAHHNAPRAAIAYANALRASRGEAVLALDGRSLREQIAD